MSATAELLLQTAQRGELHHAILCYGPNPATLREVALRIAKTLNCLNGTEGDDCTACTRIERRMQPERSPCGITKQDSRLRRRPTARQ